MNGKGRKHFRRFKFTFFKVEEALLKDPPNAEELIKLKGDLQELITLSQSLIESSKEPVNRYVAQYMEPAVPTQRPWKVGDRCEAFMSKENKYQVGMIKELLEDRTCCIGFGSKYSEIVQLDSIRPTKIKYIDAQKERKRQKVKKHEQKLKEDEKTGEDIRNKWQAFSTKMSRNRKVPGKSIFATPDSVDGRVGVGTCGIGGRPMTKFSQREKLCKGGR